MSEDHPICAMRYQPVTSNARAMATPTLYPFYEIRVRGVLGDVLLDAFPTLSGEEHAGETVLSGVVPDQAALHGVLAQIESLGLELISVNQITR